MKCSEPSSLVMRQRICDYCRARQYVGDENVPSNDGTVSIKLNFGILSCAEHKAWAERDCNAYLGRNKRLEIDDALTIVPIREFLDALRTRAGGFPVLRSSGDIDQGWELLRPTVLQPHHIEKTLAGNWCFLANAIDKERDLEKRVRINDYLRDDMAALFPAGFKDIVEAALASLEDGFYKDEVREWTELSNEPDNGRLPDIPQIKHVLHSSGVIYREFVPDAT